jgi:hypothetical protein
LAYPRAPLLQHGRRAAERTEIVTEQRSRSPCEARCSLGGIRT